MIVLFSKIKFSMRKEELLQWGKFILHLPCIEAFNFDIDFKSYNQNQENKSKPIIKIMK